MKQFLSEGDYSPTWIESDSQNHKHLTELFYEGKWSLI